MYPLACGTPFITSEAGQGESGFVFNRESDKWGEHLNINAVKEKVSHWLFSQNRSCLLIRNGMEVGYDIIFIYFLASRNPDFTLACIFKFEK